MSTQKETLLSALPLEMQTSSVAVLRWIGLCEECCRVLNLPLSTENRVAASHFLHSIYLPRLQEEFSGEINVLVQVPWFTFVQKVLAALKDDLGRTPEATVSRFVNFLQS